MQPSIASSLPAFQRHWPEVELVHLLDDSLARDVARTGQDEAMARRFTALATYARDGAGCQGALFTCSAFGSSIEAVKHEIQTEAFPVLKPNEAMMAEAVRLGLGLAEGGDEQGGSTRRPQSPSPIVVLSIFEPTLPSIVRELKDLGGDATLDVRPYFVPDALDALGTGDEAACIELIASFAEDVVQKAHDGGEDLACVALAMFSMARAGAATTERLQALGKHATPVLTSPGSAVLKMRTLMRC